MKKTHLATAAVAAAVTVALPAIVLSILTATLVFGGIALAGAWLMDRYGDLPGDGSRCA